MVARVVNTEAREGQPPEASDVYTTSMPTITKASYLGHRRDIFKGREGLGLKHVCTSRGRVCVRVCVGRYAPSVQNCVVFNDLSKPTNFRGCSFQGN